MLLLVKFYLSAQTIFMLTTTASDRLTALHLIIRPAVCLPSLG